MITETLLNSLKSLFSSLGAKTSDSNYAVGLFDKTNGEPKGLMGMSDLASVLGVSSIQNRVKFCLIGETEISANSGPSGRTILALTSGNRSADDATYSQIDMIRCGYGNNNITVVNIAKSNGSGTANSDASSFTVSSNGNIIFNSTLENARGLFIMNK